MKSDAEGDTSFLCSDTLRVTGFIGVNFQTFGVFTHFRKDMQEIFLFSNNNNNILSLVLLTAQIIKHRLYKVASLPLLLHSLLSSFLNVYICSSDVNIPFAILYTGMKTVFLE